MDCIRLILLKSKYFLTFRDNKIMKAHKIMLFSLIYFNKTYFKTQLKLAFKNLLYSNFLGIGLLWRENTHICSTLLYLFPAGSIKMQYFVVTLERSLDQVVSTSSTNPQHFVHRHPIPMYVDFATCKDFKLSFMCTYCYFNSL